MAKPDDTDKLFDELVRGKSPEELLGKNGLIKSLTKRVVEHALKAEMTEHLGYARFGAQGARILAPPWRSALGLNMRRWSLGSTCPAC